MLHSSTAPQLYEPPLAAELHYFRVPRARWPLALARLRQLGASVVSTPVPWCWHAPTPDVCDLVGDTDPQRDAVGFVKLCGSLGFAVILRPGPFVAAGLLGGGVPPWLLHAHPEIAALRADGQSFREPDSGLPRPSSAHPLYREHAQRWIERFSQHLAPLQAPNGPVIAVQLHTEPPGDDGRFRCDYNPHVQHTHWPQWLEARYDTLETLNNAWAARFTSFGSVPLPNMWQPPTSIAELRRYVDLDTFTDDFYRGALAGVEEWLRASGWRVPLLQALPVAPWGGDEPFEEYVQHAQWRIRLMRARLPEQPAFAELSARQDFAFAAPFVGGLDGACVVATQQSPHEPPIGASLAWAMDAPIRADGSVRPRLWNARVPFALLGACAGWAASTKPADIAIGYSRAPELVAPWLGEAAPSQGDLAALAEGANQSLLGQRIAQSLVRAGVAFDVLDLDAATPADLARYRLVVAPAPPLLPRATQRKLAEIDHLALVGDAAPAFDERLAPCDLLHPAAAMRLPEGVSGAVIGELVEELGGVARYAWADGPDVDVLVRHGAAPGAAYVCVANRRSTAYSGTVAYRDAAGSIEHLQLALGPRRVALLALLDGEVLGAGAGGEAAEGGWRVRGLRGGLSWSGGAGVVAPFPADDAPPESTPVALLLSAPQGGRFDLRRREGWADLQVFRLLLDGRLDAAPFAEEGTHLLVHYVADDERGATDCYLVASPDAPLPARLHAHLATLLRARACLLEDAAEHAPAELAAQIRTAAAALEARVAAPTAPLNYRATIDETLAQIAPLAQALAAQLTALRAAAQPADEALEAALHALALARLGDE